MYKHFLKRILDFSVALFLFILLSPVFLLVMVALSIVNRGNPFFFQARPGKKEKIFRIIKFRTMTQGRDENGDLLPDRLRLTRIGTLIRKTSLDEIPQFLNVIKGEMSLIGPRPLLPEYLPMYNEVQKRRHEVRPGITGLAQVKGRNKMLFSERLKNDVYYVDHLSFLLDLKIIAMTIRTIIFKSNTVDSREALSVVDDVGLSKNLHSNYFK